MGCFVGGGANLAVIRVTPLSACRLSKLGVLPSVKALLQWAAPTPHSNMLVLDLSLAALKYKTLLPLLPVSLPLPQPTLACCMLSAQCGYAYWYVLGGYWCGVFTLLCTSRSLLPCACLGFTTGPAWFICSFDGGVRALVLPHIYYAHGYVCVCCVKGFLIKVALTWLLWL